MKAGDKCWFTKSMRVVEVVEVHSDGYTVEMVDTRKRLFATKRGLELVSVPDESVSNRLTE